MRARSSGLWIKGRRPKNYDRMEKSAHTGCAVVVSGVDANVLGLERTLSKRPKAAVLRMAKAKTANFAVAAEQCFGKCQCKRVVLPVTRILGIRAGATLLCRCLPGHAAAHPAAPAILGSTAALPRWLRGSDTRTILGQDHHLREKSRQAEADDQAGRDQPSSCVANGTHFINYSIRPNGRRKSSIFP